MWRPRPEVAAVIIVVGWLAGPSLRAVQDERNNLGPPILNAVTAPKVELDTGRAQDPRPLRLSEASAANVARVAAFRSEPLKAKQPTAPHPALLIGLYVSYGLL